MLKSVEFSRVPGREGLHLLGQSLISANPLFAALFGFLSQGQTMVMVTHGGQRLLAIVMVPNTCTEHLEPPGQHVCETIQVIGARIR